MKFALKNFIKSITSTVQVQIHKVLLNLLQVRVRIQKSLIGRTRVRKFLDPMTSSDQSVRIYDDNLIIRWDSSNYNDIISDNTEIFPVVLSSLKWQT